ncbi:MAG TPA: radical SAM protein, partial [Polyangia bacterium]|nr:radical SAM protein [Polyangia bacterium]
MATAVAEAAPRLLVDRQRRVIDYLRISVTDRCNYRCTYCMPEEGAEAAARADVLSFDEIVALARAFVTLGVRRLRLTGGEPTVRRDLPTLARRLRELPGVDELSLSTNGDRLAALATPLRAAGVDRLNVSLDTLDAAKFARITGRGDLARVLAGLEA